MPSRRGNEIGEVYANDRNRKSRKVADRSENPFPELRAGAGIFVSILPLVVGVYVGKYVFKLHPTILLGAIAGARTTTAALGAVQEAAQSPLPAVGYTVPYAVARIVLAIFGIAILLVMK